MWSIILLITSALLVSLFFSGVLMRLTEPIKSSYFLSSNLMLAISGIVTLGVCLAGFMALYLVHIENFKLQPDDTTKVKYEQVQEPLYRKL
jgi:hypothetical protein